MQTDHQLTRLFRLALLFSLLITSLLATTPLDYHVIASGFGDKLEHLFAFLTLVKPPGTPGAQRIPGTRIADPQR